jgi:hypothetical protein
MYRVIHKSFQDFRPLLYSSRDSHAEGDHINRGRDTPIFCPTLQVLDMSTLGNAARTCPLCHLIYHRCDEGSWRQSLLSTARCCNLCGKNLIKGFTSAVSPRLDISSTCKVGQKIGVSLPLLISSPST